MLDAIYDNTKTRMGQSVESVKRELNQLRTGRASISMLDGINVDYYGSPTPLNQMCTLSTPDPGLINAKPFDPSTIPDIERAIQSADLGLNPNNDGKLIRIPIPPLTEESRKQLVKKVGQLAEEGKNAVRHIRRDANDEIKKLQKDSEISEDDARRGLDQVQKMTDEHTKQIDEAAQSKETELLEI